MIHENHPSKKHNHNHWPEEKSQTLAWQARFRFDSTQNLNIEEDDEFQ